MPFETVTDEIVIPKELNIDSVVEFLLPEIRKYWNKKGRRVILDLSKVEFITTAGLCVLATFFKYCLRKDIISRAKIIIPNDKHVDDYLGKMKFYNTLNVYLKEEKIRNREYASYMELREVENEDVVSGITVDILDILNQNNSLNANQSSVLKFSIGEVLNNVFNHSYSEINGLICAQYFPKINIAEITICDCGIGFRKSLLKNKKYNFLRNDSESIVKALEFGVTSVPETRNSGEGLSFVNKCIEKNKNGEINIISGNGLYKNGDAKDVSYWGGSLIDLKFDLNNIEVLSNIFNNYDN